MTQLFLVQATANGGTASQQIQSLSELKAKVSTLGADSTKVVCVLDQNGKVQKVSFIAKAILDKQAAETKVSAEAGVTSAATQATAEPAGVTAQGVAPPAPMEGLAHRQVEKILDLDEFRGQVAKLSDSSSPLTVDFQTGRALQEVFGASPEEKAAYALQRAIGEITLGLSTLGDQAALTAQSAAQIPGIVHNVLLNYQKSLPLKDLLNLYTAFAQGDHNMVLGGRISLVSNLVSSGALDLPENIAYLNSEEFWVSAENRSLLYNANLATEILKKVNAQGAYFVRTHHIDPHFYSFLLGSEEASNMGGLVESLAKSALVNGKFSDYIESLRMVVSKTGNSNLGSELVSSFRLAVYTELKNIAASGPLSTTSFCALLNAYPEQKIGDAQFSEEYNGLLKEQFMQVDLDALIAHFTDPEDLRCFLVILLTKLHLENPALRVKLISLITKVDREILDLNPQIAKNFQWSVLGEALTSLDVNVMMGVLEPIIHSDLSKQQLVRFFELLLPITSLHEAYFRRVVTCFEEFEPKNEKEVYLVSKIASWYGNFIGPDQMSLNGKYHPEIAPYIFALPENLFELWQQDPVFHTAVVKQGMNVTPTLFTKIPTLEMSEVEELSTEAFEAALETKGYSDSLKANLKAIWNKPLTPSNEVHLQSNMKQIISKAIELNQKGEVADEDLRIFFSNFQLEAGVCWPGLCQKIQREFRKLTLSLVKDELPASLLPQNKVGQLKEEIRGYTPTADQEAFDLVARDLHPFGAEISSTGELLASATASEVEKKAALTKLTETINSAMAASQAASGKGLSEGDLEAFAETHFSGNKRVTRYLQELLKHPEGLSVEESLSIMKLPAMMKQLLPNILKPLMVEGAIALVKGRYQVNKESSVVQALESQLQKASSSGGGEAPVDHSPAIQYAVRQAAIAGHAVMAAEAEDDKLMIKQDLVVASKVFFEEWLDANTDAVKLSLVQENLTNTASETIERYSFRSPRDMVNYIYQNAGAFARPDANSVHYQSILWALGDGNEVHVQAAAKEVYADQLGLPAGSASDDQHAQPFIPRIASSDFGEYIGNWQDTPSSDFTLPLTQYMAGQLNKSALADNDSIDHAPLLESIVQKQIEQNGDPVHKQRLLERSFTRTPVTVDPDTQEERGGKIRLTALGAGFVMSELGLMK